MKKVFLFVALWAFVVACSVDDDLPNVSYEAIPITSVILPDTLILGETYEIPASFTLPNSCYQFEGFSFDRRDSTRYFAAIAEIEQDVSCAEQITEMTRNINFEVVFNQEYIFKFYQGVDEMGDAEYLTDTIPVKSN
ncbi:MAG: hypothetical protein WBG71_05120 [Leeuwenhoekiella sp.]